MITEGAFGGTYFRNIYSGVTGKRYKKSWKKFDQKFYCSDFTVQILLSVSIIMLLNVKHCSKILGK